MPGIQEFTQPGAFIGTVNAEVTTVSNKIDLNKDLTLRSIPASSYLSLIENSYLPGATEIEAGFYAPLSFDNKLEVFCRVSDDGGVTAYTFGNYFAVDTGIHDIGVGRVTAYGNTYTIRLFNNDTASSHTVQATYAAGVM